MEHPGFGRYQPPAGPEAATEPGSGGRVLRNRLAIRLKREMDRVEFEALLRAWCGVLTARGMDRLSIFTSPSSPRTMMIG